MRALFLPILIIAMLIAPLLNPIRRRMRTAFSRGSQMDGLALIAARSILSAPRNVFRICAWGAGTMKVDPWRIRAGAGLQRVGQTLRAWFASLFTGRRVALAGVAVIVAMLAMQLSTSHAVHASPLHVLLAIPPAAGTGSAKDQVTELRTKHTTLLREAEALMKDGKFENDAARSAYDAKLDEAAALEAQIRTLEGQPTQAAVTVTPEVRQQIIDGERTRVREIRAAAKIARLPEAFAEGLVSRGVTLEEARAEIFKEWERTSNEHRTDTTIQITADARDKFQRGALNWLLVKSGMTRVAAMADKVDERTFDPGEFRGMTLLDLARMTLERGARSTRGMDKMRLVSEAFTLRATESVSDFTTLLENLMNKVLQAQYAITPDTWRKFCNVSSNTDFRAANRYRWGNLSVLDTLTETGEFKTKPLSDAEKATMTVSTKGNIINLSRQMVVNDDMGVFTRLPQMMGRAAALSIEVDVYALLAQNSGDGPALADGHNLFDNTYHFNKPTGAALSAAAIDADRVAMASQKEPNGNDYTDLRPAVLVLPVGLGGQARVINTSQYDPDTVANKSQMKPNLVVGLFREVVDTPRISGTRRYLFADPSIAPVLEVAFLEGQTSPVLETQEQWRTDGAEMRVRFDYGTGAVDYRGAVTNAGA